MADTFQVENSLQTNKIHRIREKGNPGTGKKTVSAAHFSVAGRNGTEPPEALAPAGIAF
jgi:hypothetical protein